MQTVNKSVVGEAERDTCDHRDVALNPEHLKAQSCYFDPWLEADKSLRRAQNILMENSGLIQENLRMWGMFGM